MEMPPSASSDGAERALGETGIIWDSRLSSMA